MNPPRALLDWLVKPLSKKPGSQGVFWAGLYLAGLLAWLFFFQSRMDPEFYRTNDWPKEYKYFSVLQQAVKTGSLPWHTSEKMQPSQPTDRFMAIPESLSLLAPQTQLLRWMHIKAFVIFNTLLLYTFGVFALFKLSKYYSFSPTVACFGFLIFSLNGHIVAHFSAGHSMWSGYFLLPWVLYLLCTGYSSSFTLRHALYLALALAGIVLQGGVHIFIWCLLFLGLLWLFAPRRLRFIWAAFIIAGLLSLHRLLPALITFQPAPHLLRGFPSLKSVWLSFVSLDPYRGSIFPWEFDNYISLPGLLLIAGFLAIPACCRKIPAAAASWYRFLLPAGFWVWCAIRTHWFAIMNVLPIPLLTTQRVPSRFLILPLLLTQAIGCIVAQDWLGRIPDGSRKKRLLSLAITPVLLLDFALMIRHLQIWRMARIEAAAPAIINWQKMPAIVWREDFGYKAITLSAWGVSLLTLAAVAAWLILTRKPKAD